MRNRNAVVAIVLALVLLCSASFVQAAPVEKEKAPAQKEAQPQRDVMEMMNDMQKALPAALEVLQNLEVILEVLQKEQVEPKGAIAKQKMRVINYEKLGRDLEKAFFAVNESLEIIEYLRAKSDSIQQRLKEKVTVQAFCEVWALGAR